MKVHHVALRVRDCAVAARFYGVLTGARRMRTLRDSRGATRAIWLRLGDGVALMLERSLRAGDGAFRSGHLLAFGARSLDDAARRIARAGATVVDRTESTLYALDPDGHRVGLSTYPLGPARKTPRRVLVSAADDASAPRASRRRGRTRHARPAR